MADPAIVEAYQMAMTELQRIRQENNCTEKKTISFDFLQRFPVMLMAHKFNFDWNRNVSKLFRTTDHVVECFLTKQKGSWDIYASNCCGHNALLLCNTANHSTVVPIGSDQNDNVFLATVVWVAADQARLSVPDGIAHLQKLAQDNLDGVALCYIPETKPYFPYPDNGPNIMISTTDISKIPDLAAGTPADFTPFLTTNYIHGAQCNIALTSRLMYGLNPVTDKDARSVHFLIAEPRGCMWNNTVFVEETPNGPAPVSHKVHLGPTTNKAQNDTPASNLTTKDVLKQNPRSKEDRRGSGPHNSSGQQ